MSTKKERTDDRGIASETISGMMERAFENPDFVEMLRTTGMSDERIAFHREGARAADRAAHMRRAARPPFRLIRPSVSTETVEVLATLLAEAQAGRLIGIAYAGMYRERSHTTSIVGECRRSQIYTRGMVANLQDHLGSFTRK